MRYDFFVTVWGRNFVEKYENFSLASQLFSRNIPALAERCPITYSIYTDRASEGDLAETRRRLGKYADVRLIFFEDLPHGGGRLSDAVVNSDPALVKHNVQGITANHLMAEAAKEPESAVVLLDSDFIFSNGSLIAMHAHREAGARAVAVMFARLSTEGAASPLAQAIGRAGDEGLDWPALVRLGLAHPHPIARRFFFDAEDFSAYPTQINWPVGEAGFVTHCFFPHPLMVTPGAAYYSSTMDYEVLLRSADDEAIHLVRSSDDIMLCKMTNDAYLADQDHLGAHGIERMAHFAINNTNLRHRLFMAQPIRFSAGGAEHVWAEIEGQSTAFVEAIYKGAELLLANLEPGDAKSLVYLKSFLGPIEDYLSPQQHARMKDRMPPAK